LIKALEEKGIGRPSTYAPIIGTIRQRGYIRTKEGRLHPLELGETVNKVLVAHFASIVDTGFTAHMEEELDEIAQGKQEEIEKLNPKKKDQAAKRERLLVLVNERKELLARRTRRRAAAAEELVNIAGYVRENLARILSLCKASLTVLRDFRTSRETERRLIEDLKTHFKEQIRDSLHHGPVTKLYIETLQREVSLITQELSSLIAHDVHALAGLYQSIHDHVEPVVRGLASALAELENKKDLMAEDAGAVFAQMERQLSSLLSAHRFELSMTEPRVRTVYPSILLEKRKESFDRLFSLLSRERRASRDRRSNRDRRMRTATGPAGPERRNGKDRRAGTDRRNPASPS
jgi:hypothetical protein